MVALSSLLYQKYSCVVSKDSFKKSFISIISLKKRAYKNATNTYLNAI